MHEVLGNRLGGLSLPRKSVVRLTDRPDLTLDVYRGCKTTTTTTSMLLLKCKLHYVPNGFTIGIFSKYTKNVYIEKIAYLCVMKAQLTRIGRLGVSRSIHDFLLLSLSERTYIVEQL